MSVQFATLVMRPKLWLTGSWHQFT